MIERRQFLGGLATSLGVVATGCGGSSTDTSRQPPAKAVTPAAPPGDAARQPIKLFSDTGDLIEYPVTSGQMGIFLTFEGLCGVVLPTGSDPVRVGLLAGHHHLATLKLHRDAVKADDTWEPTTADDKHFLYALKGLNVRIKASTGDPIKFKNSDTKDKCSKDDETWEDLGWALQVKKDLKESNALKANWWKNASLVDTVFELDRGWLEYRFEGNEPVNFKPNTIMWELPGSNSKRALKQVVRYRLVADNLVLEARTLLNPEQNPTKTLTLKPGALVYVGAKHFPVGPTQKRFPEGKYLDEANAYYGLIENGGANKYPPKALKPEEDCEKPSTPDCSCCPPAIYY